MAAGTPRGGGGYDLEEIRRRADIVETISPHVALRKRGRRLVGLCPFHQERTPSFTVDPETGLWHCFGCKAGGDLFRFVEMIEKVSFAEAVELLARRLGVRPRRPADAARQRQRERLLSLHQRAADFFAAQLRAQVGKRALDYVRRRGLSPEAIEEFRLGYAPDSWEALLQAMNKQGFPPQEVARAGLAVERDQAGPAREGGFYDRFRDRLIFPIQDAGGRVVAFGGRAMSEEQQAKYLNSPETPIFQKGRLLYAFDRARRHMGEAGRAIVVEGYMDAIACHEAGIAETVATMGTALTADHVELLRRRVPQLVLAFDADSAGLAAALRGRELFQRAGLAVRVAALPENADPDEVIRGRGAEAFRELAETAVPLVEWELTAILGRARGEGEQARMEAFQDAIPALARVPTGVEREYYVRWLAQQWGHDSPSRTAAMESAVREQLAREEARSGGRGRRRTTPAASDGSLKEGSPDRPAAGGLHASLLAAFIQHGELAAGHSSALEASDFPSEEMRAIFAAIRRLVDRGETVTPEAVLDSVEAEARGLLAELALGDVPPDRVEELVTRAVGRMLESRLARQEALLRERLEEVASERERQGILQELTEFRRRRSELAGRRLVGD